VAFSFSYKDDIIDICVSDRVPSFLLNRRRDESARTTVQKELSLAPPTQEPPGVFVRACASSLRRLRPRQAIPSPKCGTGPLRGRAAVIGICGRPVNARILSGLCETAVSVSFHAHMSFLSVQSCQSLSLRVVSLLSSFLLSVILPLPTYNY